LKREKKLKELEKDIKIEKLKMDRMMLNLFLSSEKESQNNKMQYS
jgi:hypothetical protein